jgi:hypothetical protein
VAQPVARELVEEVLPLGLVDPVRWALAEPRLEEIVQVASITGNRGRRIGLWLATTATLDAAFPTPSIHSSPSDPKVGPSSERSRTAGFALSPAPSHVRTSLRSFVTTLHSGFPVVGLRRLPRYDGSHLHRLRSNAAGQVLLCLTKTPALRERTCLEDRTLDTNVRSRAVRSGRSSEPSDACKWLYQAETPPRRGFVTYAGGGTRTPDTRIMIPLL